MSAEQDHDHSHDAHVDDATLDADDALEIVEDDGAGEPMVDDDDDYEGAGYDGEIVIGAPMPGEEDELMGEGAEEQLEDNSISATSVHKENQSIFALSLHPAFPNPPLAVSGGEDDTAYVYAPLPPGTGAEINADTFNPITLDGHTDSVVAAEWSSDGAYVATGGMDGRVRVWKHDDNFATWAVVADLESGSEIQWIRWHPKGPVLAAGCEDATVWLWQVPSGNVLNVLSGHTMPVTQGVFPPPAGRQLLTASLDSSLILWNPAAGTPMFKASIFCPPNDPELDPSEVGITALAVSPNGTIAAVGSAAGKVKLVSLPKGDVVGTLEGHGEGESVEALVFIDLLNGAGGGKGVVLVSGGTDGKGFVWDVATGRVRAELKHDEPITSLAAHPAPAVHLVTSASADRILKTWDVRTGALVTELKGHAGVVNSVSVAPLPESAGASDHGLAAAQAVISGGDEGVSLVWKL
ncbi:60S ribosomal subunit assembly or modification protein [Vanrija albida]|uniref:60S ribosomal subunit assembly or modification protein n=1 Tax=Vanrija albida TaxID=181172 RepID=A0ABR3Q3T6_9TREE